MPERHQPPQDFAGLKSVLRAQADQLSPRLRQVAEFALRHPDEVAFGTAATVATHANVQPSTLVRFAQALGYSGFSSLQQVFRSRLTHNRQPDYQDRMSVPQSNAAGGPLALLGEFAETAVSSLIRLREDIDETALSTAIETLARAETIYLLGMRRSFPLTAYLAYAFDKLGVKAVLLDNLGGVLAEKTKFVTSKDALLLATFNPYTPQTIDFASLVYGRGAPVISVTDSALSPAARVSTVMLEVVEADLGAFRSLSATFCLAMTIAVGIGEMRAGSGMADKVSISSE